MRSLRELDSGEEEEANDLGARAGMGTDEPALCAPEGSGNRRLAGGLRLNQLKNDMSCFLRTALCESEKSVPRAPGPTPGQNAATRGVQ